MEVSAAIGLGSNVGDRMDHIERAFTALAATDGLELLARSTIIETEPVGPIEQGSFLNAAAVVRSELSARDLLRRCHEIERLDGRDRDRAERWGPRTLDLDLLLYGSEQIDEPGVTIPHPRMHERLFVLAPLSQIAGHWLHPDTGVTIECLLRELEAAH